MRGFLNEIKNVAINRATNRINNIISDALGGGTRMRLDFHQTLEEYDQEVSLQKLDNPFSGQNVAYPEDLGSDDQGHYIMIFEINEQKNANVKFGTGGRNVGVLSPEERCKELKNNTMVVILLEILQF